MKYEYSIPDGGGVTLTISESVIHVNTGEDLDLDCLVSELDLAFYIRNRYRPYVKVLELT